LDCTSLYLRIQFGLPIDLQVGLTDWRVSYSPNDWPAGRTTHLSFAFQSSTVQAEREAKLCVCMGALSHRCGNLRSNVVAVVAFRKHPPNLCLFGIFILVVY
jgi:hypothetical protein